MVTRDANNAVITESIIGEYPSITPGIKKKKVAIIVTRRAAAALIPLNLARIKISPRKRTPRVRRLPLLSISAI